MDGHCDSSAETVIQLINQSVALGLLVHFKERFNPIGKKYSQIKRENLLISLSVSQGLKLKFTNSQNASDFQLIICK